MRFASRTSPIGRAQWYGILATSKYNSPREPAQQRSDNQHRIPLPKAPRQVCSLSSSSSNRMDFDPKIDNPGYDNSIFEAIQHLDNSSKFQKAPQM
jgi:hypothetical protein